MFKYEKAGRLRGKYTMSDRQEEFVDINKGPKFAERAGLAHAAVTYRLGMESILDYPNKFVGPKNAVSVIQLNMINGKDQDMQKL